MFASADVNSFAPAVNVFSARFERKADSRPEQQRERNRSQCRGAPWQNRNSVPFQIKTKGTEKIYAFSRIMNFTPRCRRA